jgi:hypothetical protein
LLPTKQFGKVDKKQGAALGARQTYSNNHFSKNIRSLSHNIVKIKIEALIFS